MSIITDSKGLSEKKDPDNCNVFKLFQLIAPKDAINKMKENYLSGGYGYGHAKKELLNLILNLYSKERSNYNELTNNKDFLFKILELGEEKAKKIAVNVLQRVKKKLR